MPQALKTLSLIHFWDCENSLFPLLALWGNKNWTPSMKGENLEFYGNKNGLCKRMQLVQFECPRHWKPTVSFSFKLDDFPFPIIGLLW